MATCLKCSAKLLADQIDCRACGEPLPPPEAEEEAPRDSLMGRVIAGKYAVLAPLGEGAMGRVYEARHTTLDKRLAIKVLHRHLAADPRVGKRFHREARAASRLSHPNSLHIIDFGEDHEGEDTLYIAMELLEGAHLLEVIERDAPLRPARILDLMQQTLSALEAAHQAGIIHRDLKPENVIVQTTPDGREHVKVCDFGIAKIQEAEGGSAITVSGFVCGTPEFMAPEQARGEPLDRRADIYAAGCMLYQMLTEEMPFTAESALGIITKHLTERPVAPRERRPEWNIPFALEQVCLRAMAKERSSRFATAAEMIDALTEAVDALGDAANEPLGTREGDPTAPQRTEDPTAGPTPAPPRSKRRDLGWIAAGVGVGMMAAALAIVWWSGSEDSRAPTASASPPAADPAEGLDAPSPQRAASDETSEDGETAGTAGSAPVAEGSAGSDHEGAAPGEATDRGATGEAPTDVAGGGAAPNGRGMRQARATRPGSAASRGAAADGRPDGEPRARENDPPGQRAYEAGREHFLANDVAGAIARFEEAARHMPRNPQVHKQLGRAYMRAGAVDRAAEAYRRYLELAPEAADRAIVERLIERGGR